ncbi:uncharacterized protein METZ01_LOCUS414591, partial [marine metagenome]
MENNARQTLVSLSGSLLATQIKPDVRLSCASCIFVIRHKPTF